MANLQDIAKKCEVSVSAVCTAINHPQKISKPVRDKILNAARELGYFEKKEQKIKKILVVMDNYQNHYYGEYYNDVIFGVTKKISELKLDLRILDGFNEEFSELYGYDGIIFIGKTPVAFLQKAKKYNIPHVLAGHGSPEFVVPTVLQETTRGITQLMEYVLSCGHKNIALLTGETNPLDINWNEFYSGFVSTLGKAKITFNKNMVFQANYSDVQTVEIEFNKILSRKPKISLIVCSSDLLAYYVYLAAKKYGVKIPENISITGFDDVHFPRFVEIPKPLLTTAAADRILIGKTSVDHLINLIKNPGKAEKIKHLPMQAKIGRSVRRI
jgi:DNA-binding LacI/PurR family transcriptional regulator